MPRPSRQDVDDAIVDGAAALFARHGFAQTSLQAVADAVGYSKAGLLHHYPSKEALWAAAQSASRDRAHEVLDLVGALPLGPDRDRRALGALLDATLSRPGVTALTLSGILTPAEPRPEGEDPVLLDIFGVDPRHDPDRLVRVVMAVAGLSVATLVAHRIGAAPSWRGAIAAAAFDALGHPGPGAPAPPRSDQVEA